jgi:hypothetical protein
MDDGSDADVKREHPSALIFINQLRQKIGVMYGNDEVTSGGNSLKYYASVRMEVRRQIPKGAMTMGHTGSSEGSGGPSWTLCLRKGPRGSQFCARCLARVPQGPCKHSTDCLTSGCCVWQWRPRPTWSPSRSSRTRLPRPFARHSLLSISAQASASSGELYAWVGRASQLRPRPRPRPPRCV